MSRSSDAFDRLQHAMLATNPGCINDPRFIDDDVAANVLAPICRPCPLFDLCAEYAELARPKGGTWAGKRYASSNPRKPTNRTTTTPNKKAK
jgi:hypothetical protein